MSEKKKQDTDNGVPVRVEKPSNRFRDGVPVAVNPPSVPKSSDEGSKSGQKATNPTPKEK